jgi:hypothetical protein
MTAEAARLLILPRLVSRRHIDLGFVDSALC